MGFPLGFLDAKCLKNNESILLFQPLVLMPNDCLPGFVNKKPSKIIITKLLLKA